MGPRMKIGPKSRVGPNFENLDFEAHRGTMAVGDPHKLKYQISGL